MMNLDTKNFSKTLPRKIIAMSWVLAFLIGWSVESFANHPTVNQVPQDVTIDPFGLGMDPFIDWLNNNGNADIVPAAACGDAIWTNNSDEAEWNFTCSQFNGCITIVFSYADDCGNEQSYPATFCMEDNTPPLCGFPNDLSIDCADPAYEIVLAAWLAHEIPTDISHPVTTEHDFDPNNIDCGEGTVVTWTYIPTLVATPLHAKRL